MKKILFSTFMFSSVSMMAQASVLSPIYVYENDQECIVEVTKMGNSTVVINASKQIDDETESAQVHYDLTGNGKGQIISYCDEYNEKNVTEVKKSNGDLVIACDNERAEALTDLNFDDMSLSKLEFIGTHYVFLFPVEDDFSCKNLELVDIRE